jgi:hypothetical protein
VREIKDRGKFRAAGPGWAVSLKVSRHPNPVHPRGQPQLAQGGLLLADKGFIAGNPSKWLGEARGGEATCRGNVNPWSEIPTDIGTPIRGQTPAPA